MVELQYTFIEGFEGRDDGGQSKLNFIAIINSLLREGWKLQGGISVTVTQYEDYESDTAWYQALYREVDVSQINPDN